MASLSNINGLFDVHSTGAILFSTSHGTSGQILRSNGNAAPTWVAASTVIGGPYLPLTGGTLSGPLSGTSATFTGKVLLNANNINFESSHSGNGLVLSHHGVGPSNAIVSGNSVYPDTLFINNGGTASDWSNVSITGNVGIGDTSPQGKLEVSQNMSNGAASAFTSPHLRLSALNTTDSTGFVGMTFATSTANNYGFSWGALRTVSALGGMHLRYHGNSASGNDIFNIDYVGNVTIASTRYIRSDSSGGYLTIQGGATYPGGRIDMYGGSNASAGIEFRTGGAIGSTTLRLRIDGDTDDSYFTGNLGIGVTSPGAKLDVNQGSKDFVQRNYGSGNNQGAPQKITITKWYPVTSLGTKLLIPVYNQGSLNMTTIVRMWGHSAVFNRASGYTNRSFTLDFTFGSLRLIYGLTTLNSSGNISSITQTSSSTAGVNGEIQVNFANNYIQSQTGASYGGVFITLEYMTGSLNKSIIPSGIALN